MANALVRSQGCGIVSRETDRWVSRRVQRSSHTLTCLNSSGINGLQGSGRQVCRRLPAPFVSGRAACLAPAPEAARGGRTPTWNCGCCDSEGPATPTQRSNYAGHYCWRLSFQRSRTDWADVPRETIRDGAAACPFNLLMGARQGKGEQAFLVFREPENHESQALIAAAQ